MALAYMAVTLTAMLLFTGLAVDGGRGYVVKAQLTKAVDGAALGAARALNSGNPKAEAIRIFKANFPPGYIGTNPSPDPTAAADFYDMKTDVTTGINTNVRMKMQKWTFARANNSGFGEFSFTTE